MQISLPNFIAPDSPLARPFWDAIDRGEFVLPRCSRCGRWQWYPDEAGPDCGGAHYEWVLAPRSGTVYTATTIRGSFLPGQSKATLRVVFVELDGVEGVRVALCTMDESIAIADAVRVDVVRCGDRFLPVVVPARG